MAHNIPTWTLAAGLVVLGMAWYQAIFTIMVANIIVLIPMLANSHAGTKFGIPFPVFARGSFGVFGANLPALIRAGVACGWFGIQTWIGGSAVFIVLSVIFTKLLGSDNFWTNAGSISIGLGDPEPWTKWLSFAIFWALNVAIIIRGMDAVRRFENWAAPFVLIVAVFLLIWMTIQAGGFGPLIEDHGTIGWSLDKFWFGVFPPALMAMIAFWSTLSLNMPDFTRFGRSQREQAIGQALGLPTTMTLFPLIAVLVTSATIKVYGEAIWDPVTLVGKFDNLLVVVLALVTLGVATLSVNVAANLVSPSYDFSNAWPKRISFRTGGLITAVIGILIQPWMLYQNPQRLHLHVARHLRRRNRRHRGRPHRRLLVDAQATVPPRRALSGRRQVPLHRRLELDRGRVADRRRRHCDRGLVLDPARRRLPGGPFPPGGILPFLKSPFAFADYSWVAGLIVTFVLYGVLTMAFGDKKARFEEDDIAKVVPAAAA